ncbi:MAG: DUF5519 family protein [Verrucomicrobiota bacterium]|nr:DUF5519 family protein [Verrucomicrobiota bacterium]MDQ6939690.1 DUF5519 family protein [Verrucomicrobiota bacterium]
MIFRFVVRKLRWLGAIPLLPQIFDATLLALTALTAPRKLRGIQLLENAVQRKLGAKLGGHRFGGTGFYVGGVELGHVHGNGLLDVLVGRQNRDAVVSSGRAFFHHVFPASGWVSFWIRNPGDVKRGIELLRLANEKVTRGKRCSRMSSANIA